MSSCVGPAWLCPPVPASDPASAPTCAVNALGAADQLGFQPASQALTALRASDQLYQPIAGVGVPLRESIERANTALASPQLSARTTVVLMVNAQPSCRWSEPQTTGIVANWRAQRRVDTHVIALPGANDQGMGQFAALAQAGGQPRVIAPTNAAALQSALQSIVAGSLSSCTLTLDPAVSAPDQAHVIVGVQGVEQEVPRTADTGEALWTISDDGKQLMLLGKLCTAASGGAYDSLRVAVGCVQYPTLVP
jgi:RES domain-containing protein